MMSTPVILLLLTLSLAVRDAQGHGRMIDPPARGSLWRFGFKGAEKNYNDNGDRCGGKHNPADIEGVICGVCGDAFEPKDKQRKNEHGGVYGKGIIAKNYTQGELINVTIHITAAHKGWFEFRLCKPESDTQPDSQECLNQNLLKMAGGATRYQLGDGLAGHYTVQLYLPEGLTCDRCVLQWRYHTGNNWGTDAYGTGNGHGNQEEFYGCADVGINPGEDNDDKDGDEDTQNDPNNGNDEEDEEESENDQDGNEDENENEDGQENEDENEKEDGQKNEDENENEDGQENENENENEDGQENEDDNENEDGQENEDENENEDGQKNEDENENEDGQENEDENENEDGQENEDENENGILKLVGNDAAFPLHQQGRDVRCKSAGHWAGLAHIDSWCQQNCLHNPPNCPITHCQCWVVSATENRKRDKKEEDEGANERSACPFNWFVAEDASDSTMNLVCQQECAGEANCPAGCSCYDGQLQSCQGIGTLAGQPWAGDYCRATCAGGSCPADCDCE